MNRDEHEHILMNERIMKLEEQNEKILALLEPISKAYNTTNVLAGGVMTVAKWIMGVLLFFSVLIGLILGVRNL